MRRLITFLALAATTAGASIYWLYNGDMNRAAGLVQPVLSTWNADSLADEAGIPRDAQPDAQPDDAPPPEEPTP